MRERFPNLQDRIILLMDTGGGSYLHLSVEVALLCQRNCVDVYVLPSYTTKACSPLDQQPHSVMSTLWSGFKAAWSRSHGNLTIWTALAGIKRCVEAGNTPKNALAGWAHCGWVPGECLQRQVVLSERAAELFHSKKGQPLQPMKSQASSALSLVAEVAPAKRKCTRANCKGTVTVTDKYCPHCGNENQHFDNKAHQAYYGARSGWYRQEDEPQVSAETPAEKELAGGIGDLFKTLRKRQVQAAPEGATAPANPATPAPATPAPLHAPTTPTTFAPLPAPSTPAKGSAQVEEKVEEPAAKKTKTVADAETVELDLGDADDIEAYILHHFHVGQHDTVRPVAKFFVQEMRSQVTKKMPLSAIVRIKLVQTKQLNTKAGRKSWLDAWAANRAARFITIPKG